MVRKPVGVSSGWRFGAGQSESVRDVQFSMKDYFTFAASFENGNVQLWDIRRPDRYERMFTAHTGPVFCCDWHPDDRYNYEVDATAADLSAVQ